MATTLQPRSKLSRPSNKPKRVLHRTRIRRTLDAEVIRSHALARELRNLYGLPPITEKQDADVIKGLEGIARHYADDEESSVDAIKAARESIY
jgi:hypothetical protein